MLSNVLEREKIESITPEKKNTQIKISVAAAPPSSHTRASSHLVNEEELRRKSMIQVQKYIAKPFLI